MLQVCEAIDTRDGASLAELVSFKHPHVANPRLQVGGGPRTHVSGGSLGHHLPKLRV